ncbi:MAG: dienelactone hydrolase [Hydrogenophilales bacterium 17-61-9]|nr:MAG: dienelactone hydrolase [Hydrogenophilales bacterium 17-61-9]
MKRLVIAAAILASAHSWAGVARAGEISLTQATIKAADGSEVPIEIATPAGTGPFPPVLFIHAKRGYEGDERAHVRELAEQGFLVVAPDWQSGRFIERWPSAHNPDTELDVETGLDYLKALPNACKQPVGVVGLSRGPYYAIRLAAKRGPELAAIVSYYGHMQNPNAPEPDQLFRIAPEITQITTPMLFLIGDADYELRRMNGGRAFYALWERGVPVEWQEYPMARRAFDFRPDQTPEEKVAARHARERAKNWLTQWMRLTPDMRCR